MTLPEAIQRREDALVEQISQLTAGAPALTFDKDSSGQNILWLASAADVPAMVRRLKEAPELCFDRLSDITAYDNIDQVDGPKRFILVYELYSMKFFTRLRIKVAIGEDEEALSLTTVWSAANWLEREVFDMFGIRFSDHPDLRRILMDERFEGHPLRKEYDLKERQPFPDSLPVRIIEPKGRLPG